MVKFLSSWVKTFGLTVVIISILEMLLPNNKTKKYIRMVMGIYIIFTMISPFISDKKMLSTFSSLATQNLEDINLDDYVKNQTSMDKRLEELYQDELEKDIIKKLNEKGYEVKNCNVKVTISSKEEETQITKIKVNVSKLEEGVNTTDGTTSDSANNSTNDSTNGTEKTEKIENKIVAQIQKIKPIDTSINKQENKEDNSKSGQKDLNQIDIQNIKKFLIEEYEVKEKCLEIN